MNANIVAWAIVGLAGMALWHFVFEAILLPSMRQDLRYKLFALRDRLRAFKAEHSNQCPDETFHVFDDQLSWFMDNLPRLNFPLLNRSMQLIERNPEIRAVVEQRLALLAACELPEYVALRKESTTLALRAMALNSGGWIAYLLPLAFAHVMWEQGMKKAQKFAVVPTTQIEGLEHCPA